MTPLRPGWYQRPLLVSRRLHRPLHESVFILQLRPHGTLWGGRVVNSQCFYVLLDLCLHIERNWVDRRTAHQYSRNQCFAFKTPCSREGVHSAAMLLSKPRWLIPPIRTSDLRSAILPFTSPAHPKEDGNKTQLRHATRSMTSSLGSCLCTLRSVVSDAASDLYPHGYGSLS